MSDDIKVDDEVKQAEAAMMIKKAEKEHVDPHVAHISAQMSWIVEEQERLKEMFEDAVARESKKKAYFEEVGLGWDKDIADLCDDNSMFILDPDLKEFKKRVDKLSDWFMKSTTKLGGLL